MLILSYPIQSNSFATPLLEGNYDIRTVRKFLGHLDVKTTMITNVLKRCSWGVRSPIDEPWESSWRFLMRAPPGNRLWRHGARPSLLGVISATDNFFRIKVATM